MFSFCVVKSLRGSDGRGINEVLFVYIKGSYWLVLNDFFGW